jgi:hypothetical protein
LATFASHVGPTIVQLLEYSEMSGLPPKSIDLSERDAVQLGKDLHPNHRVVKLLNG